VEGSAPVNRRSRNVRSVTPVAFFHPIYVSVTKTRGTLNLSKRLIRAYLLSISFMDGGAFLTTAAARARPEEAGAQFEEDRAHLE
jgi:hypothetical protein